MKRLHEAGQLAWLATVIVMGGIVPAAFAADSVAQAQTAPAVGPATAEPPASKLPINIKDVTVPPRYGSVIETHEVPGSDKLIIHIQDAHTNYSAQQNLAEIIRELARRHNVTLVLTEGGEGTVDLTDFKQIPPHLSNAEWRTFADDQMKRGLLGGEEYADLTDETLNLQLYGVEDLKVYEEGYDLFEQLQIHKPAIQEGLTKIGALVGNLKLHIYNPALKELDEKNSALNEGRLTLTDYYIYLDDLAKKHGVDISRYPNVMNFMAAGKIEPSVNFDKVNEERTTLLEQLTAKLPEEQMDNLLGKSVDFRTGKIKQSEYYSHLLAAAGTQQDIPKESYAELAKYGEYVSLVDKIKMNELANDVDRLEEAVQNKLSQSDDERRLSQTAKHLKLYQDLLEIKLSPVEYEYIQNHRADFTVAQWLPFLNAQATQNQLVTIPESVVQIDQTFPTVLAFFENARQRDDVFYQKATVQLGASGEKVAMLITGGFHTPQLTRMLREGGVSYVVIAPKVDDETNMARYRDLVSYRFRRWKQSQTALPANANVQEDMR